MTAGKIDEDRLSSSLLFWMVFGIARRTKEWVMGMNRARAQNFIFPKYELLLKHFWHSEYNRRRYTWIST